MESNNRDIHDNVAVTTQVDKHEAVHDETLVKQSGRSDQAGAFLQTHARREVTAEENKYIVKKIDLRLLPILLLIYFLQQLDKSALAYSSVFGLLEDAHLVGQQYSWLGSVIYIAQLVMQPLIAYVLVRFPTGKFLASMVLCWGTVQSCMAAAHNFHGLLVARLFLGIFEASVAPIFITITTMWWRRGEQTNRNAAWYSMNGVTNILGSALAYGLGHIDSPKLHSYQIIFMFCGLITVVAGVAVWFLVPDSPMEARFFNEEEKVLAVERLAENNMGVVSNEWKWSHVTEALLDLKTWCWFCLAFSISVPSGGITTFGPLILRNFGFSKYNAILLNMPFGAIQIIATMGGAAIATATKRKGPALALLCVPPIAGTIMLLILKPSVSTRGAMLAGYYLISFYPGISPLIFSWSAQNTAGETKKKVTTAILFIALTSGNIIGPQLYTQKEAPRYRRGLLSSLILFVLLIVLTFVITLYLTLLNKSHSKRRVALGKPAIIVDRSMMTDKERAADRLSNPEAAENAVNGGENGLSDMTDLKNEDFVYLY